MLAAAADVNARNVDGSPAILYAVEEGHAECVRGLLARHPDLETPNKPGTTVLGLAADRGFLNIVALLLEAGADVNGANSINGMTPLHFAAQNNNLEVARFLMRHAANPNLRNKDGTTPLMYAALRSANQDMMELLAQGGGNPINKAARNWRTNRPRAARSRRGKLLSFGPPKGCGRWPCWAATSSRSL